MAGPKADHGDVHGEFHALVSGSGVYDLSLRAKISLTGGDRVRWLNGMVTNNIRDLAQNFGVYAFLLNPQGRILGDLVAFQRGEGLLVNALVQLGGTRELSARKQKTRMASFCKKWNSQLRWMCAGKDFSSLAPTILDAATHALTSFHQK